MLRFIPTVQRVAGLRAIGSRLVVVSVLLLCGCVKDPSPTTTINADTAKPRPSVTLRVLVVNEPGLAEAIGRLRGEWAEQSGGRLQASAGTWDELSTASAVDADVLVFPSRYMGELCATGRLRPVRPNVLDRKDLELADVYPLIRRELIQWGGQVMALPLGVDLPAGATDVTRPPAILFLMHAAQEASSGDRPGVLFDSETMKPRIAAPLFVDALRRLAKANTENLLTPPPAAHRVPLLGYADRLAGVAASSRNAASAFNLLAWLARSDVSSQIARVGSGTMPVRRSLASSPAWYDPKLTPKERAELGKLLQASLSQRSCLVIPRIPGVDDYMHALDVAVQATLGKEVEPDTALRKAAKEWEKTTDAHGRDTQRAAYLKHLGTAEP